MNARAQDVVLASDSLTEKQLAFARFYVECRNATTAYRMAYRVEVTGRTPEWLYNEASRQLHHPRIALAIGELQEAAAASTIIKARELVQDLVDMASVDPEEIQQHKTIACRWCHGEAGRYQWRDEDELLDAVQEKQDDVDRGFKHVKMPDPRGGFGYNTMAAPNPACVKCLGAGIVVANFTDMTKLSTKARKVVKGVRSGKMGTEVLVHDVMAVRMELAKILGLHGKDIQLNPAEPDAPVAADASEAEAATGYLEMLG